MNTTIISTCCHRKDRKSNYKWSHLVSWLDIFTPWLHLPGFASELASCFFSSHWKHSEKIIDILTWCKILIVVHTNSLLNKRFGFFDKMLQLTVVSKLQIPVGLLIESGKMRSVTVDGGESGRRGAMERIQDWFLRSSQPLNTNQADEVIMVYQLFVFCWFSLKSPTVLIWTTWKISNDPYIGNC